jgi:hypothetical protein
VQEDYQFRRRTSIETAIAYDPHALVRRQFRKLFGFNVFFVWIFVVSCHGVSSHLSIPARDLRHAVGIIEEPNRTGQLVNHNRS